MCYSFDCTLLNPYIYAILGRMTEKKPNNALLNYCVKRLYCVKIYLLLSLSDLHFYKFILYYQYQYQYQILILILHQYSSFVVVVVVFVVAVLIFVVYICIPLKMFEDDTFHIHKEQNLALLLINT